MKIKATCSIGRPQGGRDDKRQVTISIQDEASRAHFVEIAFTHEDFSKMLGGLSYVSAVDCEVRGLHLVGKTRITERRSVECPIQSERDKQEEWLRDNYREEGWQVSSYLRSQSSVQHRDEKTILNFTVFKYVDEGQSNG